MTNTIKSFIRKCPVC